MINNSAPISADPVCPPFRQPPPPSRRPRARRPPFVWGFLYNVYIEDFIWGLIYYYYIQNLYTCGFDYNFTNYNFRKPSENPLTLVLFLHERHILPEGWNSMLFLNLFMFLLNSIYFWNYSWWAIVKSPFLFVDSDYNNSNYRFSIDS